MPTICIPRVFPNIDRMRIHRIFDDLNIGNIESIDLVCRRSANGDMYNLVYVHFDKWFNNENANTVRTKLLNGEEVKIIYDEPWYWKVTGLKEHQHKIIVKEPAATIQLNDNYRYDNNRFDNNRFDNNRYDNRYDNKQIYSCEPVYQPLKIAPALGDIPIPLKQNKTSSTHKFIPRQLQMKHMPKDLIEFPSFTKITSKRKTKVAPKVNEDKEEGEI